MLWHIVTPIVDKEARDATRILELRDDLLRDHEALREVGALACVLRDKLEDTTFIRLIHA